MANACFFTGMLMELFVSWISNKQSYPALRMMTYTLGFAFALLLTGFLGTIANTYYF